MLQVVKEYDYKGKAGVVVTAVKTYDYKGNATALVEVGFEHIADVSDGVAACRGGLRGVSGKLESSGREVWEQRVLGVGMIGER